MSEYMGLIAGDYEAKGNNFAPGGASLHSIMTSHGPDTQCFEKASTETLEPKRVGENSLVCIFNNFNYFKIKINKNFNF